MTKPIHFVKDSDVRPARPDGTCFYCRQPLGYEHNPGCVIRSRTIIVKVSFALLRVVPEDFDVELIEFGMNESSSCADNLLREIAAQMERLNEDGRCLCGFSHGEFVREATEDDKAIFTVPTE